VHRIEIKLLTKKKDWARHPFKKVLESKAPLLIIGEVKGCSKWNHAICTRDGWLHDLDKKHPEPLTQAALYDTFIDILKVYVLRKLE
jgi:hypothetical protein